MKASDITTEQFCAAVDEACERHRARCQEMQPDVAYLHDPVAMTWDVVEILGLPEKLVLAKARKLIKQDVIDGCACGCRGDFYVIRKA